MELLVISVGRCKMNSCFHAVGLALILVLGAFYGATNTGAEPRPDRCSGILHRDRYGLRLGCGRGEGEDICVIRKKDERKVLAVCALGRYCRIQGLVDLCQAAGECVEISGITSVGTR